MSVLKVHFNLFGRIASIRLIPDPGGWRVEVAVQKELENLRKPMHATAGGATFPK